MFVAVTSFNIDVQYAKYVLDADVVVASSAAYSSDYLVKDYVVAVAVVAFVVAYFVAVVVVVVAVAVVVVTVAVVVVAFAVVVVVVVVVAFAVVVVVVSTKDIKADVEARKVSLENARVSSALNSELHVGTNMFYDFLL